MHRQNEKLNRVNDQDKLLTQLNLRVEATNKYTGYNNTVSNMINLDSKKCKKYSRIVYSDLKFERTSNHN